MAEMEVVVLGSGAFAPARNSTVRNPAGYAVRLGQKILIFDLGFGNLRQFARAGLDPADVTDVFLTHRHPDHVGDLAALMFMYRYDLKPKAGKLRLWGPPGLRSFWRKLAAAYAPWLTPRGYKLQLGELASGQRVTGQGWEIATLKVPHPTPALAYRLRYKGKSLVYSGDTQECRGLADFAAGADLFLIECTLREGSKEGGHLTPKGALAILEASGCRRGVFTHISEDSEPGIRRLIKPGGRFRMARDLMRLKS